jgi:hypothetical protein
MENISALSGTKGGWKILDRRMTKKKEKTPWRLDVLF